MCGWQLIQLICPRGKSKCHDHIHAQLPSLMCHWSYHFLNLVTRDVGAATQIMAIWTAIRFIHAIYSQLLHKLRAEATSAKQTSIGKAQLEVVWPLTNNCQRYLGTKTSPSMEANTLWQRGICATWECYRQLKMQLRVLTNLSGENGIAYHKGVKKHVTTKSSCQPKWWICLPMCMPPS